MILSCHDSFTSADNIAVHVSLFETKTQKRVARVPLHDNLSLEVNVDSKDLNERIAQ